MADVAEPDPSELDGRRWVLVELEGEVVAPEGAPYVELDLETSRVFGSGGCNRLLGAVEVDAGTLRFGAIGRTRMACEEEVMRREGRFLACLAAARAYEVAGTTLSLTDGERVLARFAAGEPVAEWARSSSRAVAR